MAGGPPAGALAWLLVLMAGCAEPHYEQLRWPIADAELSSEHPQPIAESAGAGLGLYVQAMTWESAALTVELELANLGDGVLTIERDGMMLAWEELEYAPEPVSRADAQPDPLRLELGAGARGQLRLRYAIGRPLLGSGASLLVRKASRDGVPIVELAKLSLPGSRDLHSQ